MKCKKKNWQKKKVFFSVFEGVPLTPLKTLKYFLANFVIYFFCSHLRKIHLVLIQDFLHNNLLMLFKNGFCSSKAF